MLKGFIYIVIALSVAVLITAALLGPESLPNNAGTPAKDSGQAAAAAQNKAWCEAMDAKPNAQWQGDEFKQYAERCLAD